MTKAQVLKDFRSQYGVELKMHASDDIAKNEMFWAFADSLCKCGAITTGQYNRWANPF